MTGLELISPSSKLLRRQGNFLWKKIGPDVGENNERGRAKKLLGVFFSGILNKYFIGIRKLYTFWIILRLRVFHLLLSFTTRDIT